MEGSKRVQYEATFAVSLATLTTSAAFYWAIPVVPKFYDNEVGLILTKSEISWVIATMQIGGVFSSILASYLCDKFGRKKTLLGSAASYILGSLLIIWPLNFWMLIIGRMLWGCGNGVITTVSTVYIPEIADKSIRATLSAITRFMFGAGLLLMLTIGSFVSYQVLSAVLIVLPIAYFIVCLRIPESPYYLLKVGKVEEALNEYQRLCGCKDEKLMEEKLSLMQSDVKREMQQKGSYYKLLTSKRYRKALVISSGLRLEQVMSGSIPVQMYLAHILLESNSGLELSTTLLSFGIFRFLVGMVAPLIVDRIGRRPLLISSFIIGAVIWCIIGFYFFFQSSIKDASTNPLRFLVFIAILIHTLITGVGYNTLIYIIPSEVFPLNVRSISSTVFSISTSVLIFIALKTYQPMEDYLTLYGVFWFYAVVSLSGAIFSYFIVPETKGKALRDIQIELQGDLYDNGEDKEEKEDIEIDDLVIKT